MANIANAIGEFGNNSPIRVDNRAVAKSAAPTGMITTLVCCEYPREIIHRTRRQ